MSSSTRPAPNLYSGKIRGSSYADSSSVHWKNPRIVIHGFSQCTLEKSVNIPLILLMYSFGAYHLPPPPLRRRIRCPCPNCASFVPCDSRLHTLSTGCTQETLTFMYAYMYSVHMHRWAKLLLAEVVANKLL